MKTYARLCGILLLASHVATASAQLSRTASIEETTLEILNAKDSFKAAGLYFLLFEKTRGAEGIRHLQHSQHDSIAIQAAWQEIKLSIPKDKAPAPYQPDKDRLKWFLAFFERRAKVTAPEWWAELLLGAKAYRRGNSYFGMPAKNPYHNAGIEDVNAPHDTTIRPDAESFRLTVGKDSIVLPREIVSKSDDGSPFVENVSAAFTPAHCFVAVHDPVGSPHDVACINRSTGKLVWRAQACGDWWGSSTGYSESWVSVIVQDDRVAVFGSSGIGVYAHAFRPDNGQTLFRFSTGF
jgi:hypothetical protein